MKERVSGEVSAAQEEKSNAESYLKLETDHPLAIAALHIAEPGRRTPTHTRGKRKIEREREGGRGKEEETDRQIKEPCSIRKQKREWGISYPDNRSHRRPTVGFSTTWREDVYLTLVLYM